MTIVRDVLRGLVVFGWVALAVVLASAALTALWVASSVAGAVICGLLWLWTLGRVSRWLTSRTGR